MFMYICWYNLFDQRKKLNVTKVHSLLIRFLLRLANYCFLFGFIIIDYLRIFFKKNSENKKK